MSITIIAYVSRKPSMSPAEFKAYYEDTHMPFIKAEAGDLFPTTHKRQYLQLDENESPVVFVGDKSTFDYDAIAELAFPDMAAVRAYLGFVVGNKKIMEDADIFMDQTKNRVVVVGDVKVTSK